MSSRLWPPLLLLALAACITDNPAFKATAGQGGDTGGDTGDDVTASTVDDDPTPAAPTTTADPGATTTADPGATTTADPTTTAPVDPDTTTTGETTGDPDATTGEACNINPVDPPCAMLNLNGRNYLRCEAELAWEAALISCSARCASLVMFTESTEDANPESLAVADQLRMLMTQEDKETEDEILDGDLEQQQAPRASWWIGGYRDPDSGTFQWLGGTPMPAKGKGGWNPDDPDPSPQSGQNCAALAVYGAEDNDGKWYDRHCDRLHRYLCELP